MDRKDFDEIIKKLDLDEMSLEDIDESCWDDEEFSLAAIHLEPSAFEYVSDEKKNNRVFVLKAVRENGRVLEYVNPEYKSDKEIVFAAATQDDVLDFYVDVLRFASGELMKDKQLIIDLLNEWAPGLLGNFDPELLNDREMVLQILEKYENLDEFPSEVFWQSRNEKNENIIELALCRYSSNMIENFRLESCVSNNEPQFLSPYQESDIIVRADGYCPDMLRLEYAGNLTHDQKLVNDAAAMPSLASGVKTSVVITSRGELLGFVFECRKNEFPSEYLDEIVNLKIKACFDDIIINMNTNKDGSYFFERYGLTDRIVLDDCNIAWNAINSMYLEEESFGHERGKISCPECFTVDEGVLMSVDIVPSKDFNSKLDGGYNFNIELDCTLKKIAPGAFDSLKKYNFNTLIVFIEKNVKDVLGMYEDDGTSVMFVCLDGKVEYTHISHEKGNIYYSGCGRLLDYVDYGRECMEHDQYWAFIECCQLLKIQSAIGYLYYNKSWAIAEDDTDVDGDFSVLDVDNFLQIHKTDFEIG